MSKTVAYIRVSTVKQLDGAGPDQQRASIAAWALAKGVLIDEIALDSESGDVEDRAEIVRLKAMAAAGQLKLLVVDRLDRFARDALVSEVLYRHFAKHGVRVESVSQQFDDSPAGQAMRQMLAVFAQLDKAQRLSHLKACRMAKVARKGTWAGGKAPLGYAPAGNGKLRVDPEAARVVARVFQLRNAGHSGLSEIARLLWAEGFRTSVGTEIHAAQVRRILQREAVYKGEAPVHHVQLSDDATPQQPKVIR